ncbi:MAG: ankyrin repeat domain-containing protein [Clostridia bacterium]
MLSQSAWAQQSSLDRLLSAVEEGDAAATAQYVSQGLDPNSTGPNGQTILMAAARLGRLDVVKTLLSLKADPNRRSAQGDTALMMASLGGHLDIVKTLFASGARMDTSGWNALHYAAYSGSHEIVHFLVLRGADKNALAPNWDTPLILAIRNGRTEAAKALIEDKADLTHRDKNGQTALGLAKAKGEQEIVQLLAKAGAPE